MRDAVIAAAVRTPTGKGKPGGALAAVHPVELLAHTLRSLIDRSGVDPALVDDVIGGCVDQVGEQAMNTTRSAWLSAGFPDSVPAVTVDRQCGSSQQAVHFAAQGVIAGAYELVVACGVESMSRVPMGSNVLPGTDPFGPGVAARFPGGLVPQGISAELIAAKWSLTREQMDVFATVSHTKAAEAYAAGRFAGELVPVSGHDRDESVRPGTTPEILAGLRPA
ncbi:MAG: thiolase family protein, partial [Actinomadura sp.]